MRRPLAYVELDANALAGQAVGATLDPQLLRDCAQDMHDMLAELRAKAKSDRSTMLRVAGNVASGICADPTACGTASEACRELVAERAVDIAQRIIARIDAQKV